MGHPETPEAQTITPETQVAMLASLLDALRIDAVDLVANDSGGLIAQLFVARYTHRARTLLLTNCDVDENSPPPQFAPVVGLEVISYMPEEDAGAGEMQQAEEVVDVPFPASHKPPEVVEPGKKSFDLPAVTRTTDTPPIPCDRPTPASVRGDHLDPVGRQQLLVERVAVIAAVTDQPRREVREEAGLEGGVDEVRLIR